MVDTTDSAEKTQDETTADVSSETSSEQQSSEATLKFSEEDFEKEVQKRVSDIQAKRGDERISLEAENKTLKESILTATATEFGMTLEQVKAVGISDPAKVKAFAEAVLSGKKQEQTGPPSIFTDPGGSAGGGGRIYKQGEAVKSLDPSKMTPQEIRTQVKELETAEKEGRIQ